LIKPSIAGQSPSAILPHWSQGEGNCLHNSLAFSLSSVARNGPGAEGGPLESPATGWLVRIQRGRYRFDFFFAFLVFFLGIIFLTAFLAFLAIDFAALTTRLVTDFFLCLLGHGILLSVLISSISS
jgi:hypothetical protein